MTVCFSLCLHAQDEYHDYIQARRSGDETGEGANLDADDAAGECDAACEGQVEGQGEEEQPMEVDALVEVQPDEVVNDCTARAFEDGEWLPALKKQMPLKLASLQSIDASSIAPTVVTPSRNPLKLVAEAPSATLTPSPVSPPVVLKEIYLIAESPLKAAKTELDEDTLQERLGSISDDGHGVVEPPEPRMSKEAAMRELALLEAQLFSSQLHLGHARPIFGIDHGQANTCDNVHFLRLQMSSMTSAVSETASRSSSVEL